MRCFHYTPALRHLGLPPPPLAAVDYAAVIFADAYACRLFRRWRRRDVDIACR